MSRAAPEGGRAEPAGDLAGRHRLAVPHFVRLADGGGGADTVAALRDGQRSRRMVLLRSLADTLADRPGALGPLPDAAHAWQVLAAADRADPAAAEAVVMHPFVGTWLAATLRTLHGGGAVAWPDAGYLHALAAAAAVRAGTVFRLRVPILDGAVLLPGTGAMRGAPGGGGLPGPGWGAPGGGAVPADGPGVVGGGGAVRGGLGGGGLPEPGRGAPGGGLPGRGRGAPGGGAVPADGRGVVGGGGAVRGGPEGGGLPGGGRGPVEGSGVAEVWRDGVGRPALVRCGGAEVRIADPGRDGPGWWTLRRLRSEPGAATPGGLVVDDLDPWRNFLRRSRPERLPEAEFVRWQREFGRAWRLIDGQDGIDPGGVAACLLALAPLPDGGPAEMFSGSAPDSFGGVLMSTPGSAAELAAALVHEAQHVKLSALGDLVPLQRGGLAEEHYSPWRGDPRPVRGVFQGVYAFLGVGLFWRSLRARGLPPGLRAEADFEFALRRAQVAEGLRTVRAAAELTDAGEVFVARAAAAVGALFDDEVPAEVARAAGDALADHRMLYRLSHLRPSGREVDGWARVLLAGEVPPPVGAEPELRPGRTVYSVRTALLRRRFAPGAPVPPGACAADLAWAAGDHAYAVRAYRERLTVAPDDPGAWVGLALSLPPGPIRTALHAHPETAFALPPKALPFLFPPPP